MVLIIHHLESQWAGQMIQRGVDIDQFCENVYQYLCEKQPSKCILTRMEDVKLEPIHVGHRLDEWISDIEEYGYGWDEGQVSSHNGYDPDEFVEGGQHSELVWVPDWIKELPNEVHLCGCFDGECIEDMTIALQAAGKNIIRVESLII